MANIKDKIEKLLSLAQSPNENEAKAALLKAKELMAKNKLTEDDFKDAKKRDLKKIDCDDISWTTDSGDFWMVNLCKVLADNYCCSTAWYTWKGTRTHSLCIVGIGDDVDLCKTVIYYAVGFVRGKFKSLQRRDISRHSYADGFVMGLEMAFDLQKEEHPEWGLVVQKPDEVKTYEDALGTKQVRSKQPKFDPLAYIMGQNDGKNFNTQRVLEGCQ